MTAGRPAWHPPAVTSAEQRFGTIVLAGIPNAGKSTLLNRLVGEPLAIVSPRPQATRFPTVGLRTEEHVQLAFIDPPGLLEPTSALQDGMHHATRDVLSHADAILRLCPVTDRRTAPLPAGLADGTGPRVPVLTVRTKADLLPGGTPATGSLRVSAVTGEGLEALLAWCRAHTRRGAFRHSADALSTQPVRFFVGEYVREAALGSLEDELPYAIATEVTEFREGSKPLYIGITLFVETRSQKRIVIGKGGRTVRAIGAAARARIEAFLGEAVYLDLWVKTLEGWRQDANALRRLGFHLPRERSR